MKKELFIILMMLILTPSVLSIEISLSKSSYKQQETLQAQINGNFFSLNANNIKIYRDDTPRPLPTISDLTRQQGIYHFYAVLPNIPGNYSLIIEDAQYIEAGDIKDTPITKEFTVKETNTTVISVNPGFIETTNKDFSIKVKSIYGNKNIAVIFEANQQSQNITLIDSIEKTIDFSVSDLSSLNINSNIKIAEYNIPVFYTTINGSVITDPKQLEFIPKKLKAVVTANKEYFFKIILGNLEKTNLTNIKLTSDLDTTIVPDTIESLEANKRTAINVTISIPKKAKGNLTGTITAEQGGETFELPVIFEITNDATAVNLNGTSITQSLSCSAIGFKCEYNEYCDGEITASLEGDCCQGECKPIKSKGSGSQILQWIIFIAIVLAIFAFIFWRYKKTKKPRSTQEILRERTKKFEQRMKQPPQNIPPAPEVRGKLDKV